MGFITAIVVDNFASAWDCKQAITSTKLRRGHYQQCVTRPGYTIKDPGHYTDGIHVPGCTCLISLNEYDGGFAIVYQVASLNNDLMAAPKLMIPPPSDTPLYHLVMDFLPNWAHTEYHELVTAEIMFLEAYDLPLYTRPFVIYPPRMGVKIAPKSPFLRGFG